MLLAGPQPCACCATPLLGTDSPEKLLPVALANVLPWADVGEAPHGGVQG